MLVILALSINLLGDWLRDALNPKLRDDCASYSTLILRAAPISGYRDRQFKLRSRQQPTCVAASRRMASIRRP